MRVQSALEELSSQYASTKFVRAVATEVIPNYPDANVPTLLVYHNRAVKATLVGLKNIAGAGSSCTASGESAVKVLLPWFVRFMPYGNLSLVSYTSSTMERNTRSMNVAFIFLALRFCDLRVFMCRYCSGVN